MKPVTELGSMVTFNRGPQITTANGGALEQGEWTEIDIESSFTSVRATANAPIPTIEEWTELDIELHIAPV